MRFSDEEIMGVESHRVTLLEELLPPSICSPCGEGVESRPEIAFALYPQLVLWEGGVPLSGLFLLNPIMSVPSVILWSQSC